MQGTNNHWKLCFEQGHNKIFNMPTCPKSTLAMRHLNLEQKIGWINSSQLLNQASGLLVCSRIYIQKGRDSIKCNLFPAFQSGEGLLCLCVGFLSVFGMLGWCTYTSYGFAGLPIDLIRSHRASKGGKRMLGKDEAKINIETRVSIPCFLVLEYI